VPTATAKESLVSLAHVTNSITNFGSVSRFESPQFLPPVVDLIKHQEVVYSLLVSEYDAMLADGEQINTLRILDLEI
jgi:hypothetical protein